MNYSPLDSLKYLSNADVQKHKNLDGREIYELLIDGS